MTKGSRRSSGLAFTLAGLALLCACTPPTGVPDTLDHRTRTQAVESVARVVERNYPWPDTAQMIAAHLRRQHGAGAYDTLATLPDLARALTWDFRAVHGDLHLAVRFGVPPGPTADHGIERFERLEGNVGYLKLRIIGGSPQAFDAVTEALRSLDGTEAMILDLRGVPGGSAQMANFLISHFTAPNVLSLRVYFPATGHTTNRYTLATVPGPRRTDLPLYVLVDGRSASAAEDIPFVLQNLGRATIVGERTVGAGRNAQSFPASHGLVVSLSVTRVYDPATGREWERVGVLPDLATTSEEALTAAHQHALDRIAQRTR